MLSENLVITRATKRRVHRQRVDPMMDRDGSRAHATRQRLARGGRVRQRRLAPNSRHSPSPACPFQPPPYPQEHPVPSAGLAPACLFYPPSRVTGLLWWRRWPPRTLSRASSRRALGADARGSHGPRAGPRRPCARGQRRRAPGGHGGAQQRRLAARQRGRSGAPQEAAASSRQRISFVACGEWGSGAGGLSCVWARPDDRRWHWGEAFVHEEEAESKQERNKSRN
jgi:hypothetical protein